MTIENIIEKVRKLLALGKSSNANEAENAVRAANLLIDQYRLSEADISDQTSEPVIEDDSYIYETGRIIPYKQHLVMTLASHYGCAVFNNCYFPEGRKVSRYKLLGRKSDIKIIQYMFAYLTSEIARLSEQEVKGQGKVVVFSYCNGFVSGIAEQLRLSRKEAENTSTSNAIVKINARVKEADDFMRSTHNNLKTVKAHSHSQHDHDAYSAGKIKGKSVHLGASVGGKTVKLLGGK